MLLVRINLVEKPIEKLEKLAAAFFVGHHRRHFAGRRIERPEHRHTPVLPGRGYDYTLATPRPATTEAGVEMELRFVTIEKRDRTLTGSAFFKALRFCRLARAISWGS